MTGTEILRVTTPSDREIALTRSFDAPRGLVFDALTRPDLLKGWFFGPEGWTLESCELDLSPGGRFRYLWRHETERAEMGMGGVYREIRPGERLVHTEVFDEAWYPGEALITTTLDEEGGRTTLTSTIRYDSREARDVVLKSPMESGAAASYDRLAKLLAEIGSNAANAA